MSTTNTVLNYIAGQTPEVRRALTVTRLAKATGQEYGRVWASLKVLEDARRIALSREGRHIRGISDLLSPAPVSAGEKKGGRMARPSSNEPTPFVRRIVTPVLDSYAAAKAQAAGLATESTWLVVTFREEALGEEGLRLREALMLLDCRYRELSSEHKLRMLELAGIKERSRARVQQLVSGGQRDVSN